MEGLCVKLFEKGHEGIYTVDVQRHCEFSGSSDLCIYFVTWNMNGKRENMMLLVMGLQEEAPRNNICKLLKNTLADTHMSHAQNVEEKNFQFKHITNSLFSKNKNPYAKPAQLTVWLGDLNYRLKGIHSYPATNLIHENFHQMLTSKDQEAERGDIFNGYSEGALDFKPTYKYDIGSSSYDTSHKVRVPSWTDRILFKIDSNEINAIYILMNPLKAYEALIIGQSKLISA